MTGGGGGGREERGGEVRDSKCGVWSPHKSTYLLESRCSYDNMCRVDVAVQSSSPEAGGTPPGLLSTHWSVEVMLSGSFWSLHQPLIDSETQAHRWLLAAIVSCLLMCSYHKVSAPRRQPRTNWLAFCRVNKINKPLQRLYYPKYPKYVTAPHVFHGFPTRCAVNVTGNPILF